MKDLKEYTYNKDKQHYYQNSTKNAEVVKYSDGSICLYSYDTLIATIKPDGDIELTPYWDYSRTTGQHLRQFLKDYGFGSYGSSKDIYNDLIKKRKVATDYLDIRRDAALENAIECIEFGSGDKDDCDWCGLSETDFNDVWKQAKQEVRNKRKNNNKKEVKEEMKDVKYTQRPEKLIKEGKDDTTSLQVEYWEGGDDADLSSSHFEYDIKDVKDGIKLVKELVDKQDFAKAELHKLNGVKGNYKGFKTLFGYDGTETWGDMESIKESKDHKTIEENDCDFIALTEYEGGEPIGYTKSDKELKQWLDADEEHSWFPVDDYDESCKKKTDKKSLKEAKLPRSVSVSVEEIDLPKDYYIDLEDMEDLGIVPGETEGEEIEESIKDLIDADFGCLPESVDFDVENDHINVYNIIWDEDCVGDLLGDYLSDKYGFCHYGFDFEQAGNTFKIKNIEWDTSESFKKTSKKSIKEGKADIYQDLEDEYFKALSKAEEDGAVYFFVDDEEFYTFEDAKKYAKRNGKDKITISAFGIEGPDGYDTGDYEDYDEVVVDLNKNIVDESCKKSIKESKKLNEEYELQLSDDLWDRIREYPELVRCVSDFIVNNGQNPDPMYLTDLCVYIRNLDVDEPALFGWDEETEEDFYSWGHNSRYANVLEPMLYSNFEEMIECLVDYLDGNLDESKSQMNKKDLSKKVKALPDISKKSIKEDKESDLPKTIYVDYSDLGLNAEDYLIYDEEEDFAEDVLEVYDRRGLRKSIRNYLKDNYDVNVVKFDYALETNCYNPQVWICDIVWEDESKKSTPKKNIRESVKKNGSKKQIKK